MRRILSIPATFVQLSLAFGIPITSGPITSLFGLILAGIAPAVMTSLDPLMPKCMVRILVDLEIEIFIGLSI